MWFAGNQTRLMASAGGKTGAVGAVSPPGDRESAIKSFAAGGLTNAGKSDYLICCFS
jgi:hypothetical protein